MTWREQLRHLVDHRHFQRFIIAVIVCNAVTLGLETSTWVAAGHGPALLLADRIAVSIFVVELALRIVAYGPRFFRDPWNVFDFLVVGIALIPASGAFSVLRALRILRVLRLVSLLPSMRHVVTTLLASVPGMASIAALLVLLLYVAAVLATKLFGPALPARFGDIGASLFTLFQVMTTDDWAQIARETMMTQPLAWIFFVIYLLVSTFVMLNLFIAVIVRAMEGQVAGEARSTVMEQPHRTPAPTADILAELRILRAEIAQLRADFPPSGSRLR